MRIRSIEAKRQVLTQVIAKNIFRYDRAYRYLLDSNILSDLIRFQTTFLTITGEKNGTFTVR
ncbi:MAG: hypothetical protein D3904_03675 [Candidatus Electrothrix sp. EH2]|nr:hypothetical protein [Candidatus Electrothrix sp. EH2]